MQPVVFISIVENGSMYNRNDPTDPTVIENRRAFLAQHNVLIEDTTRLHPNANQRAEVDHETDWCRYIDINASWKGLGMKDVDVAAADGIITTDPHHGLFLPVADCVGAVFFDPVHHVLGIAHLGRHSLEQQGAIKFIEHLSRRYGSDPQTIKVWLGPAPGKDVYPIWALDNMGMKEATFEQLNAAGIKQENITDNPAETDKDDHYFSYSEFLKGNRSNDGDHAIYTVMHPENS